MKTHQIRPVKKEELPQIIGLCEAHAAYEQLSFARNGQEERLQKVLFGAEPTLYCLVVEADQKLLAYATYLKQYATWDAAEYLYLDCLFVSETARNQGIGARLMEKIKQEAVRLNCSLIQWQTPTFNTGAIRFYERMGATKKTKERFFLNV